jgi:primosomal protein N' (replication factor Y)
VAKIAVEVSLPHLDRPFDYLVPATMAEAAVPGCRVRVRFAGRLTGGYLLERMARSEHQGKLGQLERVVSSEPVLTSEIAGLARAVADRYGGTLADVLRLAIPPRHAATEAASEADSERAPLAMQPTQTLNRPGEAEALWARYRDGPSLLAALADGRSPRPIWSALPGRDWSAEIAQAVSATAASGRGALVVLPDGRDLQLMDAALTGELGTGRHVVLAAGLGPAERYRRWLAVARGQVTVVAGTRSAVFAPVANIGLVVLWDEGNDLHAEPRAPYPHARDVLVLRAHRAGCAALIGGFARTAEAAQLLAGGWARPVAPDRESVRRFAPAVLATGAQAELARDEAARSARLPSLALRTAREALSSGPVLFQVPRRGYLAAVACERCHMRVRCTCGGPAELPGPQAPLRCGWCGSAIGRNCSSCGHAGLRAVVTGAGRTAEELGRAFGSVPVLKSGGSAVLDRVAGEPAVVVATPGAEPITPRGYSAVVLLDGWAMLGLASLRAAEEALRRWMNAAALARSAAEGGTVVVVADAGHPAVQALIRWDPATFADRELADRAELRFPPAARMASVSGDIAAVSSLLAAAELPSHAEILGPLAAHAGRIGANGPAASAPDAESTRTAPAVRYLLRVPRSEGTKLAQSLHAAQAIRSSGKEAGSVRVQLDPAALV